MNPEALGPTGGGTVIDAARAVAEKVWDDINGRAGGDHFLGDVDAEIREEILERWTELVTAAYPGATGKLSPRGKFTEDDEGELRFAIGNKDGLVLLDFGKSVAWLAIPPQQAVEIAERIIDRARRVADGPLVVRLGSDQAESRRPQAQAPAPGAVAEPDAVPDADLPSPAESDPGAPTGSGP